MVWKILPVNFFVMRLLAFESHVASRNQGSFLNQDREPWERGCFCETYRVNKDESYFTTLTLQGVADLYVYGYESHLAELVIVSLIRCMQKQTFGRGVLLLVASQVRIIFSYAVFYLLQ